MLPESWCSKNSQQQQKNVIRETEHHHPRSTIGVFWRDVQKGGPFQGWFPMDFDSWDAHRSPCQVNRLKLHGFHPTESGGGRTKFSQQKKGVQIPGFRGHIRSQCISNLWQPMLDDCSLSTEPWTSQTHLQKPQNRSTLQKLNDSIRSYKSMECPETSLASLKKQTSGTAPISFTMKALFGYLFWKLCHLYRDHYSSIILLIWPFCWRGVATDPSRMWRTHLVQMI